MGRFASNPSGLLPVAVEEARVDAAAQGPTQGMQGTIDNTWIGRNRAQRDVYINVFRVTCLVFRISLMNQAIQPSLQMREREYSSGRKTLEFQVISELD